MSLARIVCDQNGVVVVAYRLRNGLEAYDAFSRELIWHARLEGLRPSRVFESQDGTRMSTGIFDRQLVHFLENVAGGNGTPVVAQYARFERDDYIARSDPSAIDTYLLDTATGAGFYWGDTTAVLLSLTPKFALFAVREPFPHVEVAAY